jgi:FixJ family two-component response regulator
LIKHATVFVIDDDLPLREALSSLIRSVGLQVRTFSTAQEFLTADRTEMPCCLVLDVRLPGLSGLDLQRALLDSGEHIPVIFITGHGDIPMTVRAMKAGAVEFLPKPFREQDLLDAIRLGLERDAARRYQRAEADSIRGRWDKLTPRERQVITQLLAGKLNKQVAAELGVSEITVKIHRRNAQRKMRVASLVELARQVDRLQHDGPRTDPDDTLARSRSSTTELEAVRPKAGA